jgi:hypothetical protein
LSWDDAKSGSRAALRGGQIMWIFESSGNVLVRK